MSLQLGLGSVRDPRASIAAMPVTEADESTLVASGCWLLAHCSVVKEPKAPTPGVRQAGDQIAAPIHGQSRLTRDISLTGWWGTREVIPGPNVE
jgi:hypothetical protein